MASTSRARAKASLCANGLGSVTPTSSDRVKLAFHHKELFMAAFTLPVRLAPTNLTQPILPDWFDHFSLLTVQVGESSGTDIEAAALDKVGTYGKQIGHLAEALEVVINHLNLMQDASLAQDKKDVLTVFLADVAAVRGIKAAKV